MSCLNCSVAYQNLEPEALGRSPRFDAAVSGCINISTHVRHLGAADLLQCLVKPSEASPTLCIPSLRKLVMSAFGGFGRCTAGSYNASGSINFLWLPCKSLGSTQTPQVELTQVATSESLQPVENVKPPAGTRFKCRTIPHMFKSLN